ncbi:MAG: electron transfer protein with DM13 domain protein [Pseudanabaena sp.]|nr:MAG: electron transfer protein with DM13 domain protein [Pseudanabaena sp.]
MKIGILGAVALTFLLGCSSPPTSQLEAKPDTAISAPATTNLESPQQPVVKNETESLTAKAEIKSKTRSGRFISGEHTTEGKASIFEENGNYFIEFDQAFKTSTSGPDLFVILHRSPDILQISRPPDFAIAKGDYQIIAPLQSYNGKQRYAIPKNVRVSDYQSVAVWCRQYNATFGFVNLSS